MPGVVVTAKSLDTEDQDVLLIKLTETEYRAWWAGSRFSCTAATADAALAGLGGLLHGAMLRVHKAWGKVHRGVI